MFGSGAAAFITIGISLITFGMILVCAGISQQTADLITEAQARSK